MKDCRHGNPDLFATAAHLFSCCIPFLLGRGVDHCRGPEQGTKMKMKLAVDRSRNRVLFADAGSDVVDVLLSFLTLPLSALRLIAGPSSSPGCLTNLCDSVNRLRNSELLKADACHGTPLMPMLSDGFRLCKESSCNCKECEGYDALARLLHVHANMEAFLRGKERFVISDDLRIKPASTSSLMSLGRMFSTGGISHDFEEVEVCVGWAEVVSMLKASLSSDTIFSDVFLSKGADHSARQVTKVKQSINQNIVLPRNRENPDSSPECKIKIFYDMCEKKVMYAECDHGFVDLLLGLLTYPVCRVIKDGDAAGSCYLSRSLINLYSSAIDLGATGFLTGRFPEEMLLDDPSLTPFPELVEERRYIVEDDLLIHQASAMSVMKHWCRRRVTHVDAISISIRKHEAVDALMQAVLTSKMALTEAFMSRQETMQILVTIETGKTITVNEVASTDTIAAARRKIEDKENIPKERRYILTFLGTTLEDSCTVAECNIFGGHTIHLRYSYQKRQG
ncbi:unnamed protein product [Alopecurus aequalis]